MEFLKVSSKSSPSSVAGAIAGMIKDGQPVDIQSVGAGAVNQAVKAIAISRGFLAPIGIEIVCAPSFSDIEINGEVRTAIRFRIEPRYLRGAAAFGIDTATSLGSSFGHVDPGNELSDSDFGGSCVLPTAIGS